MVDAIYTYDSIVHKKFGAPCMGYFVALRKVYESFCGVFAMGTFCDLVRCVRRSDKGQGTKIFMNSLNSLAKEITEYKVYKAWKKSYMTKGIKWSNRNLMIDKNMWVKGMIQTVETCDSTVRTMFGTSGKRRWQALADVYMTVYGGAKGQQRFTEFKGRIKQSKDHVAFQTTLDELAREMEKIPRDEPGQELGQ